MIELTDNDMRIFLDEERNWYPEEIQEIDENKLYQEYEDRRLEDELYGTD